jgi:hypothetical protein
MRITKIRNSALCIEIFQFTNRRVFYLFYITGIKKRYPSYFGFVHSVFSVFYVSIYLGDRLCGLVVRVLDYRCRGPGLDSRYYHKKVVGLERGPLSLVSTTEELLDRKVAAPV